MRSILGRCAELLALNAFDAMSDVNRTNAERRTVGMPAQVLGGTVCGGMIVKDGFDADPSGLAQQLILQPHFDVRTLPLALSHKRQARIAGMQSLAEVSV